MRWTKSTTRVLLSERPRVRIAVGAPESVMCRKACGTFLIGERKPPQTVDKKAILPRRGRIALSANERIAEFLDFAIQSKFDYVNKLYHQLC